MLTVSLQIEIKFGSYCYILKYEITVQHSFDSEILVTKHVIKSSMADIFSHPLAGKSITIQ